MLSHKINELWNLLEEITGNEVDIEIVKGNLSITITENKRVCSIPDDVKLQDLEDELHDLYQFTSTLPENV